MERTEVMTALSIANSERTLTGEGGVRTIVKVVDTNVKTIIKHGHM
jgi:hypothetical protein